MVVWSSIPQAILETHTSHAGDVTPLPLIPVSSVSELQRQVREAVAVPEAVCPVGGRTMLDYGLPPSRPGRQLDLRGLDRVIDYPARDMTITVQAGVTIAQMQQQVLATENQRLPVDVPLAEQATLGGALAANISGPRRLGFGTWRDYVIGITVVNDQGEEVKAGGRVVKNVAGYDLCKLYIGSLGTLGIISQVTLKVRPRPERQALVELHCAVDQLEKLLESLHAASIQPCSLTVLNPAREQQAPLSPSSFGKGVQPPSPAGWSILVGFEDNAEAVQNQLARLRETAGMASMIGREWLDASTEPLWQALTDFPLQSDGPLTFKANLLPRNLAIFCRQAAALPEVGQLQAEAASGIVLGHAAADLTLERARGMLATLLDAAAAEHGNLVLLRCPAAWKSELPVWGRPRADRALMRAVKERLDPKRVFNPGRFVY
jgi:glycolate oxidase FAD binding subunit